MIGGIQQIEGPLQLGQFIEEGDLQLLPLVIRQDGHGGVAVQAGEGVVAPLLHVLGVVIGGVQYVHEAP